MAESLMKSGQCIVKLVIYLNYTGHLSFHVEIHKLVAIIPFLASTSSNEVSSLTSKLKFCIIMREIPELLP